MIVGLALSLVLAGSVQESPPDAAIFALLERYRTSFHDVSFLYEGTQTIARDGKLEAKPNARFQAFYAYRSDGATVLDVFNYGREDSPMERMIYTLLGRRMEMLNATPDVEPKVADRQPEILPGGPGSLVRPNSAERIFFPWLFSTLKTPREHRADHQGWDDVEGQRCVKIRMLRYPEARLKSWKGDLPYVTIWFDLARDGYPLRIEEYASNNLMNRIEVTQLERMDLPGGKRIWFPVQGKAWGFWGNFTKDRSMQYTKEPQSIETYKVLLETVQFNRNLDDAFFSAKKHATAADDEGLRRLQRRLPTRPRARSADLPGDPESRRKRLDQAIEEADRQAARLDASAAAQSGLDPSLVLSAGFGFAGAVGIVLAGFLYWRRR